MTKAKKLNGQPSVMVPVEVMLELARAYRHDYAGKVWHPEVAMLEAKAYRKLQETRRD